MFAWLGAIKSLGTIASLVGKWVGWKKDRNLMDAGAAREREKAKDDAIENALRARRAGRHIPDSVSKFDRDKDGE